MQPHIRLAGQFGEQSEGSEDVICQESQASEFSTEHDLSHTHEATTFWDGELEA